MQISKLLLHPKNRQQLDLIGSGNMHAYILVGAIGAGKTTVALAYAAEILGIKDASQSPAVLLIGADEQDIRLEDIKEIKKFLKTKTTGTAAIRRIVLIVNAHTMNDESQNALLKSLEEPPEDTVIILTAAYIHGLKETIHSRSAIIELLPINRTDVIDYFTKQARYDSQAISRAYMVTGGQIGLMETLLEDGEHPLLQAISEAKQLLSKGHFERLTAVDSFAKDRARVALLLQAFVTIAHSGLAASASAGDIAKSQKWYNILARTQYAQHGNMHNANTKLLLTNLFSSI